MKVFLIDAYFHQNAIRHTEYFFQFDGDEDEAYFAETGGEWEHGFWFTDGGHFAHRDLDCWVDRIPSEELNGEDCDNLTDKMMDGSFCLNIEPQSGEFVTFFKVDRYNVSVACLYQGDVENCPNKFKFDFGRSIKEV
jgi:hypothetical protein